MVARAVPFRPPLLPTVRGRFGGWGVHVHALGFRVVAYKRGTIQSPAPPPKAFVETIDLVLLFQSLNATELKTKWQWPLLLFLYNLTKHRFCSWQSRNRKNKAKQVKPGFEPQTPSSGAQRHNPLGQRLAQL